MSRPGDKGRWQLVANGPEELLLNAVELVYRFGGVSFEHGYRNTDGTPIPDEAPEPGADDPVEWYATAVRRVGTGKHRTTTTTTGTALSSDHPSHYIASSYAVADLLEKLGCNVLILDQTTSKDPRR